MLILFDRKVFMISIKEARNWVLDKSFVLDEMTVPTDLSVGYVLAQDVMAPMDMPSFRNSAMDGYAMLKSDLDAGLRRFMVAGEIQAGSTESHRISSGEAYRIFTGALLPENADLVIIQENTNRGEEEVEVKLYENNEKENVREIGEQTRRGELLLGAGHEINPASVGLLASFGISSVMVIRQPRIGILTTGNELRQFGQDLRPGEIYESNSYSLKAALHSKAFNEIEALTVSDEKEKTIRDIKALLDRCDVVISSGGISVGKYDYVRDAMEQNGVEEVFYKINQKPGKPMFFGVRNEKLVFALPGNPASLLVCFYEYVLPSLRKLMGKEHELRTVSCQLESDWHYKGSRPEFLRGRMKGEKVSVLEGQSSFMLKSFADANCLIYIHGEKRALPAGTEVEVHPIF